MKQFYNLLRTFLILSSFLIVKQASTQTILYVESFPNIWNPGFLHGPGNDQTDQNLGTYHASSNTPIIVGAVNSPGFFDSTSLLFIDSVNTTGSPALFEISSPAIDLSAVSTDTTVQVAFLINTTGLDSTNTCNTISLQFFNSSQGFSTQWSADAHTLDSTFGDTGWHQITVPIPVAYLTNDFQLFFDNTSPIGCGTTTQTFALDQIVFTSGAFDILPVNILSFNGSYNNSTANLRWTVEESQISNYTIERSSDGKNFQSVGTVAAQNTGVKTNYTFSDNLKGYTGNKVFYRLGILETSGRKEYSRIINLKVAALNGVALSPNPARSYTNLSFNVLNEQTSIVELFDASGRIKLTQRVALYKGANTIQLNKLEQLPSGVYMLRTVVDGKVITSKMVVQ
jgi:hypothetical protein